jgi:hypothetical protein
MSASTALTRPPPLLQLPQEIKTSILSYLNNVDLICFAVTRKEHYYSVLSLKKAQNLRSLIPIFQSWPPSIHLSPYGRTPREQLVSRLWSWLGGRCAYCLHTHLELSKFENDEWIYSGHPCKAACVEYDLTFNTWDSIEFYEMLLAFDIENWISRCKVSNQAFKVLIQLLGNYNHIGFQAYRLLARINRQGDCITLFSGPVGLPPVQNGPHHVVLADKIRWRWGQWSSIRKEAARWCFRSMDHPGFLELDNVDLIYRKQPDGVGVLGDQQCICQCVKELGRPCTLDTRCIHSKQLEAEQLPRLLVREISRFNKVICLGVLKQNGGLAWPLEGGDQPESDCTHH